MPCATAASRRCSLVRWTSPRSTASGWKRAAARLARRPSLSRSLRRFRQIEIVAPDRAGAEAAHEGCVGGALFLAQARDRRHYAMARRAEVDDPQVHGFLDEAEPRLTPAHELGVDLGKQLRVEQRAVLGAARAVDAIARAEIVEPVGGAGLAAAGERGGVDWAVA